MGRRILPHGQGSSFADFPLSPGEIVIDQRGRVWTGDGTRLGGVPAYQRGVSIWDFAEGADLSDPTLDTYDAWIAAKAWCKTRNIMALYVPATAPTGYRIDSSLIWDAPIDIYGDSTVPYLGNSGARGPGSWLWFNHTGPGLTLYDDAGGEQCGKVSGIGSYRNQPAFGPGWAPYDHDFDFEALKGFWQLDDIMAWNCTRFLRHDFAGAGKLTCGALAANPYKVGLYVDRCNDIGFIQSLRFFPFKSADTNVVQYTYANLDNMVFKRVDGFKIAQYFGIFPRRHLVLALGGTGIPTRIDITDMYCDVHGGNAIEIEAGANGASFKIGMLDAQGAVLADGWAAGSDHGIVIAADNAYGLILGSELDRYNYEAALITGAGSLLQFAAAPSLDDYNLSNTNAPAYGVNNAASRMYIGDGNIPTAQHVGPHINSAVRISSPYWAGQSPVTFTPASGTIGTVSSTGMQQNRRGQTAQLQARLAVTTAGTGTGYISATVMLATEGGGIFPITGYDSGAGKAVEGYVQGTTLYFRHTDGTYAGQTGADVAIYATYKCSL